jgi:hypothetical protein
MEIFEFLENGKVKCKYFLENKINPKIEYYVVSLDSLTFKSHEPLKYRGIGEDPFWKKHKKFNL